MTVTGPHAVRLNTHTPVGHAETVLDLAACYLETGEHGTKVVAYAVDQLSGALDTMHLVTAVCTIAELARQVGLTSGELRDFRAQAARDAAPDDTVWTRAGKSATEAQPEPSTVE